LTGEPLARAMPPPAEWLSLRGDQSAQIPLTGEIV
jgi:hypothetical protein